MMRPATQERLRTAFVFGLFLIAFSIAYRYGMSFSSTLASPFWFPDSVLLCALLKARPRWWWLLLLATLPIRLTVAVPDDASLVFLFGVYLNDCAKALLGALFLRRFLTTPARFESIREFTVYFLGVVLLIPATSAFAGAASRRFFDHEYWVSWSQWFTGDAAAALVLTPALFYWVVKPTAVRQLVRGRRIEAVAVCIGLVASAWIAFEQPGLTIRWIHDTRFFLTLVFMVWAAIRFGMPGATAAMLVFSAFAIGTALAEHRMMDATPAEIARELQNFLLPRAAGLYLVAVLIEQMGYTERSLRQSEDRYRDIVDSQNNFVCRFHPDFTLTFVNEAYARFLGGNRSELLGLNFLTLIPEQLHGLVRQRMLEAHAGKAAEWEYERASGSEQSVWQHWNCYAIQDAQGTVIELQAIGQDITDHKLLEEANRNLAQAARLATVGELTAMVAHEINQPLGAIQLNAETAQLVLGTSNPPLAELREIIADILKSGIRADEVVRTIRALADKRELQLRPMNLNDTIERVQHLVASDARRRRVEIRLHLAADLPLVSGDSASLHQVLINLIVNALDSLEAVPPAKRLLSIETKQAAETVEVVVSDSGEGITSEKMARLFDSFFTTKRHGMGLGLAIARSIVQAHRGRIWAASAPEGGAAFHFTLQCATNDSPQTGDTVVSAT